jgi:uncharacterized protein DUF4258
MIARVYWTTHAELRLAQRGLSRDEIELAIRDGHGQREVNRGDADWRTHGTRADGRCFAVLYDHPVLGDPQAARVVTAWLMRD